MHVSFGQNVLLSFVPIFNSETKTLLTQMETIVGQDGTDFLPYLFRWSFSIAHRKFLSDYNCKLFAS